MTAMGFMLRPEFVRRFLARESHLSRESAVICVHLRFSGCAGVTQRRAEPAAADWDAW